MIADIIGVLGMSALVGAYFLLLLGKLKPNSLWFLLSNLLGALFLMVNGIMINAPWFYPFINLVWVVGTVYQIIRRPRIEVKEVNIYGDKK
jgi:hypothetical protein